MICNLLHTAKLKRQLCAVAGQHDGTPDAPSPGVVPLSIHFSRGLQLAGALRLPLKETEAQKQ